MSWLFNSICPRCGNLIERYFIDKHDAYNLDILPRYTKAVLPSCLLVYCDKCCFEFVVIRDPLVCIGCGKCHWPEHSKVLGN